MKGENSGPFGGLWLSLPLRSSSSQVGMTVLVSARRPGSRNVHAAAVVHLAGPSMVCTSSHLPAGAVRRVFTGAAAACGTAGR